MSGDEEPLQFAKLVWQKRFNNVSQTAYVGMIGDGRVFAVGALGSVVLDWEDIPHCAHQLHALAYTLEEYHRTSRPDPVQPTGRRKDAR